MVNPGQRYLLWIMVLDRHPLPTYQVWRSCCGTGPTPPGWRRPPPAPPSPMWSAGWKIGPVLRGCVPGSLRGRRRGRRPRPRGGGCERGWPTGGWASAMERVTGQFWSNSKVELKGDSGRLNNMWGAPPAGMVGRYCCHLLATAKARWWSIPNLSKPNKGIWTPEPALL